MRPWPITLDDVLAARARLAPYLPPTPCRSYETLDAAAGMRLVVKHENFQPTNAFKIRNAVALVSALGDAERRRGIAAATRGNHGLGLAWAGRQFGIGVTIVVPEGNNPEKNEAMRGLGARLVERGRDYDEAMAAAEALVRETGAHLAHSTNDPAVIAGAATMTLEIVEQAPDVDALVVAIGGGSQAVGALTVARALRPSLRVYGVQAAGADAGYRSWRAGHPVSTASASTFADGLATRSAYALTFDALREGLAGFVTVPDAAIADALRLLLRTTHTLVEGAGAAGLAGALALREELAGQRVGIVISGGNIDQETLRRVLGGEI